MKVKNIFLGINLDAVNPVGHLLDILDTVGSQKIDFASPNLLTRSANFEVFKAYISNLLYSSLYQGKLNVITRP